MLPVVRGEARRAWDSGAATSLPLNPCLGWALLLCSSLLLYSLQTSLWQLILFWGVNSPGERCGVIFPGIVCL